MSQPANQRAKKSNRRGVDYSIATVAKHGLKAGVPVYVEGNHDTIKATMKDYTGQAGHLMSKALPGSLPPIGSGPPAPMRPRNAKGWWLIPSKAVPPGRAGPVILNRDPEGSRPRATRVLDPDGLIETVLRLRGLTAGQTYRIRGNPHKIRDRLKKWTGVNGHSIIRDGGRWCKVTPGADVLVSKVTRPRL